MCGIVGNLAQAGAEPVCDEELRRMVAMLRHRGPDGYGLYRDERVGLGHARLSIIDLAGGAQPIHNEDRSIWICYNGEIFNYVELRAELEQCGHRFYTHSDTETIVHAFEEYGERTWEKLHGQFALALWDRNERQLWLVRDRLGILPLHYARLSDRLLFASEAKALFASGRIDAKFDPAGLLHVFSRWAAPAPSTVFEGVRSVPPGTAIRFDEDLNQWEQRYWQPRFSEDDAFRSMSLSDAADALGQLLTRSAKLRLRADVPVGAYLSGGLDSSIIAQLVRSADSSPLQTFAVRFEDPRFDETAEQRRMAERLGTQHNEVLCSSADIGRALPDVIWHCESPLLRTGPAPLFMLSGLVRHNGMKVVLTGEGADELLAGYHIFKEDKVRRFWARQPDSQVRPMLLSRVYPYVGQDGQRQTRLWQQFFRRGLERTDDPFYSHAVRWHNTAWSARFLAAGLLDRCDAAGLEAELERDMPPDWRGWHPLARAQTVEISTFLSSYLLSYQGDRVAMGHSVEVRYPFLDPSVVDFCCRLPAEFKLRGLRDKVILRALGRRQLPPEICERPKQPYRAPMAAAFFGDRAPDYVDELMSPEALARFGLVDAEAAGKLAHKARQRGGRMAGEREEMALVGVLSLQLLAHWYLDRFPARVAESREALRHISPDVVEGPVAETANIGMSHGSSSRPCKSDGA